MRLHAIIWIRLLLAGLLLLPSFTMRAETNAELAGQLEAYIAGKDARIGVSVIINGDTVEVNGREDFPMMSVFKFPVALAVARLAEKDVIALSDSVVVAPEELHENTYSPMLRKYGRRQLRLPLRELIEWSLIESDNNACDILIRRLGGLDGLNVIISEMEFPAGINIGADEEQMHAYPNLCYINRSTPVAMAVLFSRYYQHLRHTSGSFAEIGNMLERCHTGLDRLAAPLSMSSVVIGHKTGTGDVKPDGRLMAINDCGYIKFPGGTWYSIAVFVADSSYGPVATSKIIADISEIVFRNLNSGGIMN